jgi:hypothetical protein
MDTFMLPERSYATVLKIGEWANFVLDIVGLGPPLWSSGQSFWLQIQRSRVRFQALPDFLRNSGSGTGSTQPREGNWRATWNKSSGFGLKTEIKDRGNPLRCPRDTLYPQKLALTSPISGGRSVGIVPSRTKATEFSHSRSFLVFIKSPFPLDLQRNRHTTKLGRN